MTPWSLLALTAGPPGDLPTLGVGDQAITVAVVGTPAGAEVEVERPGVGRVRLVDPAVGWRGATFHGPPARFVTFRLDLVKDDDTRTLWEGMVPVGDGRAETLTFEIYEDGRYAARVPAAPGVGLGAVPVHPGGVAWGWAGVAFGAVALLVIAARGGPAPAPPTSPGGGAG